MSAYNSLLPSYRLIGNNTWGGPGVCGAGCGLGIGAPFLPLAGHYPAIADSYLPQYQAPQTRYGSCVCHGGALNQNACNFEQGGYKPQCLLGGGCRCVNATSTDWGCWNVPSATCT